MLTCTSQVRQQIIMHVMTLCCIVSRVKSSFLIRVNHRSSGKNIFSQTFLIFRHLPRPFSNTQVFRPVSYPLICKKLHLAANYRQRVDLHRVSCEATSRRMTKRSGQCRRLSTWTAVSPPSALPDQVMSHRNCRREQQCCTMYKQPGHVASTHQPSSANVIYLKVWQPTTRTAPDSMSDLLLWYYHYLYNT